MQTTSAVDMGKDPLDPTHEKTDKFGSQDKLDSDGVIKTNRSDLIEFLHKNVSTFCIIKKEESSIFLSRILKDPFCQLKLKEEIDFMVIRSYPDPQP